MADHVDLVREGVLRRTPGRPPVSLMVDGGTVVPVPVAGTREQAWLPTHTSLGQHGPLGWRQQQAKPEEEEREKLPPLTAMCAGGRETDAGREEPGC